jgi:hypothetical protein|tara:strand:+ start:856 stop:3285 length:2430 start_codon:yes stop_codon:yes gene_type:complete
LNQKEITIFKNIKDTSTPFYRPLSFILQRIEAGKSKELIQKIRKEKDKTKRNLLKQELPAICFSGKFQKRNDDSLVEYSGIVCLDFDGFKTKKDLEDYKLSLMDNDIVHSAFHSPSGYGLKVLVKVPLDPDNHVGYFKALSKQFNNEYFDSTSKNISRVCYESYDPFIYINEDSKIFDELIEEEFEEKNTHTSVPVFPITNENKIVEILMKWWTKKYGLIEGERNNNVYILAAAFNDFGVNKNLAEYIMKDFESQSFSAVEIQTTIDSAYRNVGNFGTKFYEDESKINDVKKKLKTGESKQQVRQYLKTQNVSSEAIDQIIYDFDTQSSNKIFWHKSEKGKITIIHNLFRDFLHLNGFFKYTPEGSKSSIFVRVENNLIDHTSEDEIKDFVLQYLDSLEDKSIYNFFADKTRYFKDDFLSMLKSVDVYFIADTRDTAYLYFQNCAVKITKDNTTIIDYLDLEGFVWKDHVIHRVYQECKDTHCDFKTFIFNVCNKDSVRVKSMESTLGYLLHAHKNLSYSPAVILNDEVISDQPNGGTGKSLLVNALGQMKKLVIIDGKAFAFERSFAYQLVSADTQLLCFDDIKKHFEFERLFSVVTEGITLEKKNKDAIKIPFEKSPKLILTTNYAVKGAGQSFERRKWELEFKQHYTTTNTPFMEFGKLFFGDWSDDEWCAFDNYMIESLQLYLQSGLIKSEFVNLKIRKLSAETCHEFIEWCGLLKGTPGSDKLKFNEKLYKHELYLDFIQDNPDFAPKAKMTVSRVKFYQWLVSYGIYATGTNPEEGRDNKSRWIMFNDENKQITDEARSELDF